MRLRLDLSYDGAGFHGWARQPGLRTVQGEIESALATIFRTAGLDLTVAGRTDTGVHARGQVAHVDVPDETWATARQESRDGKSQLNGPFVTTRRRLNGVLDPDVRMREVSEAPAGFDARFSALWRRYCYRIADRAEYVDPLVRGHVLAWGRPLDEDRMNEAAALLLGEHDFASFCKKREGATTIRALQELSWRRRDDGVLEATVKADAFCHNMVRSLVGCMIAVGEGRREPVWAGEVLARHQRDSGVTVVHAHGLTLEEIAYPPDDELAGRAAASRVVRTLSTPGAD